MFLKMKIKVKPQILEVFLLILISFSPLISNAMKAGLALLIILINIKIFTNKINAKKLLLLIFLMSLFILSALYDLRNISSISQYSILNLYFPLCFLLGYIISEKYSFSEFLTLIDKIVFIAAIFSLIGVVIYTFLPNLINYLPSYQYYHTSHKTAYIFNVILDYGGNVVKRNAGIAWEPGAFQFLVSIGLYSYLKTTKKINLFKIAIYAIVVITTRSTAGIIIFIFLTWKLLLTDKKARILIIISLLAFSGLIAEELMYQYRYKLFGSYAFETRLEPLLNAFNEGRNHFLGMGNSGYNEQLNNLRIGAWDSFGQIFIRYGYPMLVIITSLLIKIFSRDKTLFTIMSVTFLSQGIWYFPMVTPFYFMWYKKNSNRGKRNTFHFQREILKMQGESGGS